ncbi:hsp-110 [Pristionchus pacificus]|uniref:Hsp-110 protein n=1 Tax=Pristionchus pacificus TaxID=54126 RepID=A0A2A6CD08_PRIPA|nr:hsp-110 [Pristionchus pacificus]|eukprot:PDM76115.1 hsp-110 protein [Pristionchus pacificus]
MSVVGFDIGNLNCYIAIAKQGGIEVITNDYSLHATPACVAFGSKNRSMGVAARQAVNSNFKSTIINFKHLIGRKFSDPIAQQFIPFVPCEVVQLPGDDIGCKVSYLDKSEVFTPEQVLAALFTKLRTTIEAGVPEIKKVTDCVVSVPYFFTDAQRRAVQSAIETAKLNPLRVVNETTAVALAYGIYKQDLPEEQEAPRRVLFVDLGHSSTQASVAAFQKGKLTMLGASSWLRLLDESEKVKKQMSANQTPIPLNIECFMNDKDVSGKMQRAEFEELAKPIFDKLRALLSNLLAKTKLDASKIDEVEIVGGSSRIPMVKQIIKEMFGKDAKTTMNQDEAVARGAAMQCAILSPAFRVRDFAVKDQQPYGIKLTWTGEGGESGDSDVFAEGDEFPFSKMLTLYRTGPFALAAGYAAPATVPHTAKDIGSWQVNNVKPEEDGGPRKVKVKVRVNPNGTFSVCAATMYEVQTVEIKEEKMEVDPAPAAADGAAPAEQPAAPAPAADEKPKTTTKTVAIELPIVESLPVHVDTVRFTAAEEAMQRVDLLEKRKADAKNAVEEYVYEMRDKLGEQLGEYITEADADTLRAQLQSTEDWLYDEGEDCETPVYEQRLAALKALGDPVVERYNEAGKRTGAFDRFDTTLLRARKAYDEYVAGTAAHAHIDAKDMEKSMLHVQVINAIDEKKKWLDEARHKQETRPKTEAPAVFVHEVIGQHTQFENVVNPILNRPKPKVEPPKVPDASATKSEQPAGDAPASSQEPAEMEMD